MLLIILKNESKDFVKQSEKQKEFEDELINKFDLEKLNYKFIVCKDNASIYKILGFDFNSSMYSVKYGGSSISDEKIIFSGRNSAFYPHELVHIYLGNHFYKTHKIIKEGIATYLGGSQELNYLEHKQELKKYVDNNESEFFDNLLDETKRYTIIGDNSSLLYAGGALICDLVYSRLGNEGLKQLISSGKKNEELLLCLEK